MKKILFASLLLSSAAFARDVYVQPHIRRDRTLVEGHYRTAPDNNPYNNYSTQGNINPYTGQAGTVNPYSQPAPIQPQPVYGQPGYCNPFYQKC